MRKKVSEPLPAARAAIHRKPPYKEGALRLMWCSDLHNIDELEFHIASIKEAVTVVRTLLRYDDLIAVYRTFDLPKFAEFHYPEISFDLLIFNTEAYFSDQAVPEEDRGWIEWRTDDNKTFSELLAECNLLEFHSNAEFISNKDSAALEHDGMPIVVVEGTDTPQ